MVRWKRGQFEGEFSLRFDLAHISVEEASQGLVTVFGVRRKKKRSWVFESDSLGLQTKPNLLGTCLSTYEEAMHSAA